MTRNEFVATLSDVMNEVGYVQKDATNDHQNYRYASAEKVLGKLRTALHERHMAVESAADLEHFEIYDTQKGKRSLAVVKLSIDVTDGEHTATMQGLGSGMDAGDKAVMKANTAALKYALASGFLISWGDDPEADPNGELLGHANEPSEPQEDPTGDGDIPVYAEAREIVVSMKGKQGVKELKQFFGHCAVLQWDWAQVLEFAKGQGVDLLNGLSKAYCVKLRDMVKQQREVGVS